jgi:hypothetical protein
VGTDKTGTCDGTYNALLPLTKNIFLVLKLFTHKQFILLHSIYIGDILGFCRAVRNESQQWREAHEATGKRLTSSTLDVLKRD